MLWALIPGTQFQPLAHYLSRCSSPAPCRCGGHWWMSRHGSQGPTRRAQATCSRAARQRAHRPDLEYGSDRPGDSPDPGGDRHPHVRGVSRGRRSLARHRLTQKGPTMLSNTSQHPSGHTTLARTLSPSMAAPGSMIAATTRSLSVALRLIGRHVWWAGLPAPQQCPGRADGVWIPGLAGASSAIFGAARSALAPAGPRWSAKPAPNASAG